VLNHLRGLVLDLHNDTLNLLKLHGIFSVASDQLRHAASSRSATSLIALTSPSMAFSRSTTGENPESPTSPFYPR
jgi:hypothetical protein